MRGGGGGGVGGRGGGRGQRKIGKTRPLPLTRGGARFPIFFVSSFPPLSIGPRGNVLYSSAYGSLRAARGGGGTVYVCAISTRSAAVRRTKRFLPIEFVRLFPFYRLDRVRSIVNRVSTTVKSSPRGSYNTTRSRGVSGVGWGVRGQGSIDARASKHELLL